MEMYSLRILSKGQITDLSSGFSLGGKPFSIFVRSKMPSDVYWGAGETV